MAFRFGEAARAGTGGRRSPESGESSSLRSGDGDRLPRTDGEPGAASLPSQGGYGASHAAATGVSSSSSRQEHSLARNKQDSDRKNEEKTNGDSAGSDGSTTGGAGVLTLSPSNGSSVSSKEQELWRRLERIMAAKQSHVQQVLEEFGIADSQPSSDPMEEEVWRVAQGGLTLQKAADLV